ncbi:MAG: DNA primase [Ruminococcaceae bacterium]|nr:DNA primase [Oscillospiraceae bacterium]
MALNDSFLNDLKMRTDINDVISTYVTLKRRGRTYVGLCPFHNEKTPSFTVYPETQSFYCFGCGAGGDAVGFIRKIENLDYIDAVKLLAGRAGLQMPEDGYDDSMARHRKNILAINRETARFFHSYMMSEEGKVGLDYFLNRGLSRKTITKFGLGFAPNSWDALLKHLKSKGFSISDMEAAGVIKRGNKGYYDIFRNRVMTPIIDVRGNVIAFGGRVLDDSKPKYINTGDTLVYKKTNELFALNLAKDSGEESLILCEGYMDVIAMHQVGFTNAVAGCGTALTNEQVKLISRYAGEVILAYDADEAGQKALNKAILLFNHTDVKVRIPALRGGKDPDEIIKNLGRETFAAMLEGASNEIEFEIVSARNQYNIATTQGKIDFLNDCIKILSNVSPIEQDLYVSRLSEELGVDKNSIRLQLDSYARRNARRTRKRELSKAISDSISKNHKESVQNAASTRKLRAEDRMLGLLMLHRSLIKYTDTFDSQTLNPGFHKKIYDLVCERIRLNQDIDLIHFSDILSDNEMGRLSGIMARAADSSNPDAEFKDCMQIVGEEFTKAEKKKTDMKHISDDEFRKLFQ